MVHEKQKQPVTEKPNPVKKSRKTSTVKTTSVKKKSAAAVKKGSVKKSTATRKKSTAKKTSSSARTVGSGGKIEDSRKARLQVMYAETITPSLKKEFGYKTDMQVPRVDKIVLNMGVGEAVNDKKVLDHALNDLTKISGQKPIVTKARRSVAGFKIREGYPIGCKVTLRGQRMFEFLDRLISIAIPRVRDFRGISAKSFDGRGNFNMGVKEQIIFPEIEYDKIDAIRGLNITITTTAKSDREARSLLTAFKFPLRS